MTSGVDLKFVVDTSDFQKAVQMSAKLEREINKLAKRYLEGSITQKQYSDSIKAHATALQKASGGSIQARNEVNKYSRGVLESIKANKQAQAALTQEKAEVLAYAQARRQATEENRRFDENQKRLLITAKQEEETLERLRHKFIAGYSAMDLYSKELNDLAVAHKAGIISAEEQTIALDRLNRELAEFQSGKAGWSNQFVQGTARAGKSLNKFGMYAQQVGYQVGDFFVQMQSGTNVFVAFGQQATQLAGLLPGVAGAIVGIGISVGTMLLSMWSRSNEAAKEAKEGLDTLKSSLDSIKKTIEDLSNEDIAFRLKTDDFGVQFDKALDRLTEMKAELSADADNISFGEALGAFLPFYSQYNLNNEREILEELDKAFQKLFDDQRKYEELKRKSIDRKNTERENQNALDMALEYFDQVVELEKNTLDKTNAMREESRAKEWDDRLASALEYFDQLLVLEQESLKLSNSSRDKARSDEWDVKIEAALDYFDQVESLQIDSYAREAELRQQNTAAAQESIDSLVTSIRDALQAGEKISELNLKDPFSKALPAAQELARVMRISLVDALSLINAATQVKEGPVLGGRGYVVPTAFDALMASMGGETIKYKDKKTKGGGRSKETQEDYLAKLERELQLKRDSIGLFGKEKKIAEEVAKIKERVIKKDFEISEKRIEQIVREGILLEEQLQQQEQMNKDFQSTLKDGMMGLVTGAQSVEEAFRNMMYNIIKSIYETKVAEPFANAAGDFLSGIVGSIFSADGNVFSKGSLVPFATGGVVSSATMFPLAGGKTGVMGEAGPEAIMPLKRGPNGKLGVEASGNSVVKEEITVNNIFNINGNGDEFIKTQIMKQLPTITEVTKASIIKDRRNGGKTRAAFGRG